MSLGIHTPRRSALGVDWCDDFSRGRDAIRKAGGRIIEGGGDTITLDDRWLKFPENNSCGLIYDRVVPSCLGKDEITFGIWYRSLTLAATTFATLYGQYDTAGAYPAGRSWGVQFRNNGRIYMRVGSGAAVENVSDATTAAQRDGVHLVVCRWSTGNNMEIFLDGDLFTAGNAFAGTINDYGVPISVGIESNMDGSPNVELADPFVEFRSWSDEEISDLYRGSTFI